MATAYERTIEGLQAAQEAAVGSYAGAVLTYLRTVYTRCLTPLDRFLLANEPADCGVAAKHLAIESYTTAAGTYHVRVVAVPHPLRAYQLQQGLPPTQVDELPGVVLVHGLGGQSSQFEALLDVLGQCADVVAVDLPGFGNSHPPLGCTIVDDRVEAAPLPRVDTPALVELVHGVVKQHFATRPVVVVGHSMGTHIAVKLAATTDLDIVALALLCPPEFKVQAVKHALVFGALASFPPLVELFRAKDRMGGLASPLVARQLWSGALVAQRARQLRWNLDVETTTVLAYAHGFAAATPGELERAGGKVKQVLVITAAEDVVTAPRHGEAAAAMLQESGAAVRHVLVSSCGHNAMLCQPEVTSGHVLKLLAAIDPRLSPALTLQYKALISGDKWGLKNEAKWEAVVAVSHPIVLKGRELCLLAMKTPRENDEHHLPALLEASHPEIHAVVNIGHDSPAYNPDGFRRVHYYHLPLVSKIPPDERSVRVFIDKVAGIVARGETKVVVHCHYGFNRTGFLVCCWLVEREGWSVEDAVEAFRQARAPGIKHQHFVDELYVRYR